MLQAKKQSRAAIFGQLRCRSHTATFAFCNADVILTKSCAATNGKLHRNIEKAALQESGAFLSAFLQISGAYLEEISANTS